MSTALLKGGEDKWKKLSRERVAGMVGGFAIMASVALCCAAFLLSPSGAAPQSKEQLPGQPISREQLMHLRGRQEMMNAIVPAEAGTRKSRRTLALEAYLNRVMQGVKTLDQVDHAALAAGLTAHMSQLAGENNPRALGHGFGHTYVQDPSPSSVSTNILDNFPGLTEEAMKIKKISTEAATKADLQEEVERLTEENEMLKRAAQDTSNGAAKRQMKPPKAPFGGRHFGYPWGYVKDQGWQQEIESYDPILDGCKYKISGAMDYLMATCGSQWGALTLFDDACYGCCDDGCCMKCECNSLNIGDGMGPTSCKCPLGNAHNGGNSVRGEGSDCPRWWSDNEGALDPFYSFPGGGYDQNGRLVHQVPKEQNSPGLLTGTEQFLPGF